METHPALSAGYTSRMPTHMHTHTYSVQTIIFPGEPGLAGCPLDMKV